MSGAAFEGLDGIAAPEQGEGYEPAKQGFDESLVEEVMRWYEANRRLTPYIDPFIVELADIIGDITEQFDCQAFLDALISRLVFSSADTFVSDCLFSPLVQLFYYYGRNGFSLDLTPFGTTYYQTLLANIKGAEDAPLEVSLAMKGNITNCCQYNSHCRFSIRGDTNVFGQRSSHSEFVFENEGDLASTAWGGLFDPDEVVTGPCLIGGFTKHSIFKLPAYCDASTSGWPVRYGKRGIIHLRKKDGTDDMCEVDWDFFDEGNRLLVPDGAGSWKEVLP